MASHLIATHAVASFATPVAGATPIDANVVRNNDNTTAVAYSAHDADATIHVQDSILASQAAAATAGRKWLTTDVGAIRLWYDTGSAWSEVNYIRSTATTASTTVRALGGTVSWALRDNGDANDNILVSDAGTVTLRNGVIISSYLGSGAGNNVFIGALAGNLTLTTAATNTMVGGGSNASALTTGVDNATFGYRAGQAITTGSRNTLIGRDAGTSITTAVDITAIGDLAGKLMTTGGDESTLVGAQAGFTPTTTANLRLTAIGFGAGFYVTSGTHNTFVGHYSGKGAATGAAGGSNTAVGRGTMNAYTTAGYTVALGHAAAYILTTGQSNVLIGNTAGGDVALGGITTGSFNVGVGEYAVTGSAAINNTVGLGAYTRPSASNIGLLGIDDADVAGLPAPAGVAAMSWGIGVRTPTARLHLPAGTAAAGSTPGGGAPLKFSSGTNLTAAEAGAVEYGGRFTVTESDAARRFLIQAAASTKTIAGAPYANDGYVTAVINGTTVKLMTTA